MKKLIAILTLFIASLFIVYPQSKSQVTYVDTLKSVTVSVSTDVNKQKPVIDPMQVQFAKSLDTQITVQKQVSGNLDTLTSVLADYVQEVEAKNKDDSVPLMEKLGYDSQDVKKILKTERWLDLLVLLLTILYLAFINNQLSKRDYAENVLIKGLIYLTIGGISVFVLRWLLILIFNSGYFYIKELIALYT
jgi:hypothetical protein